ncbi:sigma-70 family RNA polymerase sigma factor [Bizionia gelidisalsuginis]|uniref:Sigma-70 family RNA polymerase sigma factor n=2 Tax=Bizionia TaxID=283785 RepID=A0A8H2LDS8_9FLAO|nr:MULTISPECIES: sigma-70 family RNA polymerase sigma factor [Bizionia]TYB72566.1 sigma-70 family RNA polymerase sigma factor [Bizionia saleffrena]TYC09186.1 sigma-70 family RNA polymerase sigma factor [Bizionia gelidisalsuginis]
MKRNISYYHENHLRIIAKTTFPKLIKSKKEGDKIHFNQHLLKIMPELKIYIKGRLDAAINKGGFPKGMYKADDFIDQLFIEIYDHIETITDDKDFYLWLFKKTNALLEDVIIEEEFDDFFFKNIDDYSKPEWDAMEENFSTDGGGDLVMIEELNDSSYNKNDYTLNHVFIEDNLKALTNTIDKDLNEEALSRHIQLVLHNLSLPMQTVFELSTKQHLSLQDIAEIRNVTVEEVDKILSNVRKALELSLLNRYPSR